MVFEFIGIPTTLSGIVWLVVQTLIVFLVIIIADRVIAHGVETKNALLLSVAAYFLPGLILFAISLAGIVLPGTLLLVLPLLVWIGLGELLLTGDFRIKLAIAMLAYVVFFALNASPLQSFVMSMVP